jgi:F420-dependent oxidoreductase-like protein
MKFGYHNTSFVTAEDDRPALEETIERASFLDNAGFSWLSVMDHLWQIGGNGYHDEPFFDAYTVLPAIARATKKMELGALVTCPHYRNPGYLGRILTTIDHLSTGRAVLGIGAGWFEREYEAYGYNFPDGPTRNKQMRDTIELIKEMWTEPSPVTYEGEHYEIEDVILEPKPVQEPRPPILIGGGGEQLTLRAAAEYADRWNIPGLDPETYDHKCSVLRRHCESIGRNYDTIEKTIALTTVIRDSTQEAHETYESLQSRTDTGPENREEFRGAVGTPTEVAETVETYADLDATSFILKVPKNDRETIEQFVDEVMPEFI